MLIDDLTLLSGQDLLFDSAQLLIHQPTLKEIGMITEKRFFIGIEFINFSKDKLSEKDRKNLANQNDFDIFMAMITSTDYKDELKEHLESVELLLMLLFPTYSISYQSNAIVFTKDKEMVKTINAMNYQEFKDILKLMFSVDKTNAENEYNPAGDKAKALAEKFKKRKEKINKGKTENINLSVYNRYASILSVALHIPLYEIMNYTVYQLMDQIERFNLKQMSDQTFSARMAGATDLEDTENWMKDLHS